MTSAAVGIATITAEDAPICVVLVLSQVNDVYQTVLALLLAMQLPRTSATSTSTASLRCTRWQSLQALCGPAHILLSLLFLMLFLVSVWTLTPFLVLQKPMLH